jgi:hypothetical protein
VSVTNGDAPALGRPSVVRPSVTEAKRFGPF